MMRRLLFIFTLTFLVSLSAFSQGFKKLENLEAFERTLQKRAGTVESIESAFIQEKYLDVFDEKVKSSGMFYYKKDQKVCLQYNKPIDYLIVINNGMLKVVSEGKTSITDLNKNKMMAQMQGLIVASIIGDLNRLNTDYNVEYFENNTHYLIQLLPKNKTIQSFIYSIEMVLEKSNMSVDRLKLSETKENYTEYIFENKKFNSLKDESIFTIR